MIEVLLATYNGEVFLSEQIESVLSQEDVELSILARDDGSSDGTGEVLERYARDYPGRISILHSPGRLGGRGNFSWLLNQACSPYVAFCDQDDVWVGKKMRTLLMRIRSLETRYGKDTPILVHSDLAVADSDLHEIHPSFWEYTHIDTTRNSFRHILVKNSVTGCALLANRALVEKARPIPEEAVMHDHWLALVAVVFGQVDAVKEPLVFYRQHGDNVVGARAYGWRDIFRRLWSDCGRMDISRLCLQAGAFSARFATQLSPEQGVLINGFAQLPERGWIGKRIFLLRHGILLPGLIRNLALLFCVRLGK